MPNVKRVTFEVDAKTHRETKTQAATSGLTIVDLMRAFIRALLKGDKRAHDIIEEYSDK